MAEAMHSEKGENSKAVEEMSRPVPNGRGEEEHELEDYPVPEDVDVTALPHISDREDLTNAEGTMFLDKARSYTKLLGGSPKTPLRRHPSRSGSPILIKKSSSCSTIYTDDSTASQPNLKHTIKCVSLAIFYLIKHRPRDRPPNTLDIFDEKLHPLTSEPVPSTYADHTPDHRVIYKFVKTLFTAAQLTAECAIISLVYLERLAHYAELDIHPCNWKRVVLGSILLSSKVWDDQAVWNVDYCQILRHTGVEDMNELERVLLENLQFNINVSPSTYARFYFDLRSLAEENGLLFPEEYVPLTKNRARKIEAMSMLHDQSGKSTSNMRKASSMDGILKYDQDTAVLS
jgi:hypothetical protein